MRKYLSIYFNSDYGLLQRSFRALAVISAVGHLLFHVVDKYIFGLNDDLYMRLVASVLSLGWLLYRPSKPLTLVKKLYFEFSLSITLPILFTCFLLLNDFHPYWLASQMFAALLFGSIIKPARALFLWFVSFFIALWIYPYLFSCSLSRGVIDEAFQIHFGAFFLLFIVGVFQTIYLRIHQEKDELNGLVHQKNKVLSRQKHEIENQQKNIVDKNHELIAINEELKSTNEDLYNKNEIIEEQHEALEKALKIQKEMQAHLIQSEKMASLGILTSGISHELNNPLNFIRGGKMSIEMKMKEENPDFLDSYGDYLNMIEEGVSRSTAVINGLNMFNDQSTDSDESCDVHEILDNCLLVLNNEIQYTISVQKNYLASTSVIKCNRGEIHQVYINLLLNAIHATSKNGIIQILTRFSNNCLYVLVKDNGHGIADEHIENVTTPFFTTKEPGQGVGLGLSIVYSILQKHQGNIRLKSKENKGCSVMTCFKISS
ncbi:sensor histidine kinase [Carboxylicivirga sp. N1Y90]|uniref:sensor histidine kinase n=1 Tax=Carboxylicivirga fragile TaxID=3417571 RepID=UPI003D34B8A7|nr:GHKL domain-containing protein [Marinilabiliaceae bacterium N1Y90]